MHDMYVQRYASARIGSDRCLSVRLRSSLSTSERARKQIGWVEDEYRGGCLFLCLLVCFLLRALRIHLQDPRFSNSSRVETGEDVMTAVGGCARC